MVQAAHQNSASTTALPLVGYLLPFSLLATAYKAKYKAKVI